MKTVPITYPLKHPGYIYANTKADALSARAQFTNFLQRLIRNKGRAILIDILKRLYIK
jgi:hypothetical protein